MRCLAEQAVHTNNLLNVLLPSCRYPIVLESGAWTTNMKQKLSCGSVLLSNKLFFYDFFTRALKPGVHFVEVDSADICNDVVTQVSRQAGEPCSCVHHGLLWMAIEVDAELLCHNPCPAMVAALSSRATLLRRATPLCYCMHRFHCIALPSCLLCKARLLKSVCRGPMLACPALATCPTA